MLLWTHVIAVCALTWPLLCALASVWVASTSEGGRIDSRHPNPGLVHLEEVGDKIIEVDVLFRIVEESEFAIVADDISCANHGLKTELTAETRRPKFPCGDRGH